MGLKFKLVLTAFLLVLSGGAVYGDSPALPEHKEVFSKNKKFVLNMIPRSPNVTQRNMLSALMKGSDLGQTAVYEIVSGTRKLLYGLEYFNSDAALSSDGRSVVRHGPWASNFRDLSDMAVAFYLDGKLLRSYQVRDLVKDKSKLMRSVSHYLWRRNTHRGGFSVDEKKYSIGTLENKLFVFDVVTGNLESVGSL